MNRPSVARVTAIDYSLRTPELIDLEFTDYDEAQTFHYTLVHSEDDYQNVCLWVRGGWELRRTESHYG